MSGWLVDSLGKGSPANAAHVLVVVPPRPKVRLRVAGRLVGRRLEITATLPSAAHGRVHLSYRALKRGHTVAHASRDAPLRTGTARATFRIAPTARDATLIISARYAGPPAQSATTKIARRRRAPRTKRHTAAR